MRSIEEVAADLALVKTRRNHHALTNIYGKTIDELAEIEAIGMKLDREYTMLLSEREAIINAPLTPNPEQP